MINTVVLCLLVIVVKYLTGCHEYSGHGKPPLFGDFEAQRHWQEVTLNLPVELWYSNSSVNDLEYWGLDYPPLTAYHSWVCGWIASHINSSWVELMTSRGIETTAHKLFMRCTVLAADVLIYIPAVLLYSYYVAGPDIQKRFRTFLSPLLLFYPGLILIDNGHFQYNNVSLGLFVLAVAFLHFHHDVSASVAFMLALNYKQMELYHALPFFFYLLGTCFKGEKFWLWKLVQLGVTVVAVFAVVWFPFFTTWSDFTQVLHRVFPVARGLYEDKVANIWCSLSVFIKWKQMFSSAAMLQLSTCVTLAALVPSSLNLMMKPTLERFHLALINSSLTFFLFSFQVHEKSILLAALPVALILHHDFFTSRWFLEISTFSMFPLLLKDGLLVPFISLALSYHLLTQLTLHHYPDYGGVDKVPRTFKILYWISVLGMVLLTAATLSALPPARFPDLWPLLTAVYSCVHFVLFLLYFTWQQLSIKDQDTKYARKRLKQH